MGKGDRKSKKGKISIGSFGVTRPRKPKADHDVALNPPKEVKKAVKKTATKAKATAPKKKEPKKAEK